MSARAQQQILFSYGGTSGSGCVYPALYWDPADKTANMTLSNGDLTASSGHAVDQCVRTVFKGFSNGDCYKACGQFTIDVWGDGGNLYLGVASAGTDIADLLGGACAVTWDGGSGITQNGGWTENGVGILPWAGGAVIDWAFDCPSGKLYYGLNGVWFNSSNPDAGTGASFTNMPAGGDWAFFVQMQDVTIKTVSIVPYDEVTLSLTTFTKIGGPAP
jgi:hypothetical protein